MKKYFGLLLVILALMVSCNVDTPRPFTGTVNVVLSGIPTDGSVGAVALFCDLNEWKAEQVNGVDKFVVNHDGSGTVTFVLADYILATPLKFQFVPLQDASVTLNDSWWTCAISGSSAYANQENNLYCDFVANGGYDGCKVKVNASDCRPFPVMPTNVTRYWHENFTSYFTVE